MICRRATLLTSEPPPTFFSGTQKQVGKVHRGLAPCAGGQLRMSAPAAGNGEMGDGRGGERWAEADSLLPQSPLGVGSMELTVGSGMVGNTRRARLALYGSHFLSTWGQRGWEFAVGLVLLSLHPSSLILVSVFGLCDAGALVLLGAAVGAYVDRTPRLRAACTMYVLQNASVAVSAGACLALLWAKLAPPSPAFWALVCVAIVAGCLASVGATGATVSVEREWTKALSGGDSAALAEMNAAMKRIDLTCLIASPIGVGLLLAWRTEAAVVAILAWNLAAWAPECSLLSRAQAATPALRAPKQPTQAAKADPPWSHPGAGSVSDFGSVTRRMLHGWAVYARQPTALAAVSLSLLYLTVMSFGTLMTAYLNWRGMGEAELSIFRGLGALSGILATLVFPALQRCIGLASTGAGAIWAQLVCLTLALLPQLLVASGAVAASSSGAVLRLLVWGLVLSRFGLWLFDLSVNQLVQEGAEQNALGTVNGVQGSLQSFFQMMAYAAGVAVWQPERFVGLMAGSVCAVGAAAALFTAFTLRSGCGRPPAAEPLPPLTP